LVREPTAAAAEDKMVDVVVSGDPDDAAGVEVVVRELVARLPVVLQWSRATGIDPVQVLAQRAPDTRIVTRAWMDLSDRKRARIYVANPWNARFVVRVVPLLDGYDEIAREVLGHIIESCVDAFLAGRDVGVTREVAEREVTGQSAASQPLPVPPATPPVPKAESSERARLGVALSYQATEVAGLSETMQGPAIGIGLGLPSGKAVRFSSSATVHYRLPIRWDSPSVGARFEGATARLGAGIEGDVTRRMVLRGQLGLGVDFMHLEPYVESGSTAKAGGPLWVTSPIVTATLSLEGTLSSRIGIFIGAGCDVDLDRSTYFVADGMKSTTVLSPWVAHPTAMVGLVFRTQEEPIDEPR
jgi:hypothetical protein